MHFWQEIGDKVTIFLCNFCGSIFFLEVQFFWRLHGHRQKKKKCFWRGNGGRQKISGGRQELRPPKFLAVYNLEFKTKSKANLFPNPRFVLFFRKPTSKTLVFLAISKPKARWFWYCVFQIKTKSVSVLC